VASDWDSGLPPNDARKADPLPRAQRHRARKDRKRWCRGKVGVEHVREVRVSRFGKYWSDRNGKPPCLWEYTRWRWVRHPKPGQPRTVPVEESLRWRCSHESYCSACGKILEPSWSINENEKRCPDYQPREGS
jgi:hypothetical protein